MIELPISAFLRNYYKEHGIAFSDSEQATIIWNSDLPKSAILEALQEIADKSTDEVLKKQIQERLSAESEHIRFFCETDSRYFFVFESDDTKKWENCYFTALEAAIAYGKDHSRETFKILKEPFSDRIGNFDLEDYYIGGQALYAKDGILLECECYTEKISVSFSHPDPSRFEDAYISLQNPFELGDIVRIVGDSRPAIVQVSQEMWQRGLERNTDSSRKIPPSYDDLRLTVEFLDDGEMYHGHPSILLLEKIEHWDDQLEWDLLQEASHLVKGDGSLDAFLYYYHQNKERKRNEKQERE